MTATINMRSYFSHASGYKKDGRYRTGPRGGSTPITGHRISQLATVATPDPALNTHSLNPRVNTTSPHNRQAVVVDLHSDSIFPGVTTTVRDEIYFFVDWDDPGSKHKALINKGHIHGDSAEFSELRFCRKVYENPGTYRPKFYSSRLMNGQLVAWGYAELEITVADWQTIYTPDKCLYITGDSVETPPATALGVYYDIEDAYVSGGFNGVDGGGSVLGILVAKGQSHISGTAESINNTVYEFRGYDIFVGEWGSASGGADIVRDHFRGIEVFAFRSCPRWTVAVNSIRGQYSPVTGRGAGLNSPALRSESNTNGTIFNLGFSGMHSLCAENNSVGYNQYVTYWGCDITDWQDIGIGLSGRLTVEGGYAGCYIKQNENSKIRGGGKTTYSDTFTVTNFDAEQVFLLPLGSIQLHDDGLQVIDGVVYLHNDASGYYKTELIHGVDCTIIPTTSGGQPALSMKLLQHPTTDGQTVTVELAHAEWPDHGALRMPTARRASIEMSHLETIKSGWSTPPNGEQPGTRICTGAIASQTWDGYSDTDLGASIGRCFIAGGTEVLQASPANSTSINASPLDIDARNNIFKADEDAWQWLAFGYTGISLINPIFLQSENTQPYTSQGFRRLLDISNPLSVNGNELGPITIKGAAALNLQPNPGNASNSYSGGTFDLWRDVNNSFPSAKLNGKNLSQSTWADFEGAQNYIYSPNNDNAAADGINVDPLITDPLNFDFTPLAGSRALATAVDNDDPAIQLDFFGKLRPKKALGPIYLESV